MALITIDSEQLQRILARLKALEDWKSEVDRAQLKQKQDIEQALRETGAIRNQVGGFT